MESPNKNWKFLIKPSGVVVSGSDVTADNATFVIEPLERGFGLTLGNALRRVLLSSLQGVAVVGIYIAGVSHEYDSIHGVVEDLVDIILNVKRLSLNMKSYGFKKVSLDASGPCVVTAGMIDVPDDVTVINPSHKICTLSQNTDLHIDFFCASGKGYMQDALYKLATEDIKIPVGAISIDSSFSPVLRVSYNVDDTRIGRSTDYDKLSMNIETNGTVRPDIALALAARIIQDQLQPLIIFEDDREDDEVSDVDKLDFDRKLLQKIDSMEISVRSSNCLKAGNIIYVGDLVTKSESDMLKTPNFGRKSLDELKQILIAKGLTFGMTIKGWPPENLEEIAQRYSDSY